MGNVEKRKKKKESKRGSIGCHIVSDSELGNVCVSKAQW